MANEARSGLHGLWSSRGIELTVQGPDGSFLELHLDKPFAWIGSDPRADVVLSEGKLLRCNLYLHATDEGLYCLGMSRSTPNGWMRPKSYAELGTSRIAARLDDGGPPRGTPLSDPRTRGSLTGPKPRLEIRSPSGKTNERFLSRQLTTIGRESPSMLRLKHKSVSQVHCVLYWDGQAMWFVDLLSRNGTRLNGEARDAGKLLPGETLTLGQIQLRHVGVAAATDIDSSASHSLAMSSPAAPHEGKESIATLREQELRQQIATMQGTIEQLRQDCDQGQAELALERARVEKLAERLREVMRERNQQLIELREQLAERLRAVEQSRESELARLRQELQDHERLTQDEQNQLRQEAMAQEAQLAQRLDELKTRAAEIDLLRQERDERQSELVAERGRAEQLAERLRAVEQSRESELGRLHKLQDQERLTQDEPDRLRQEAVAERAQSAERLNELKTRAAEIDLLRQERDERQNELVVERGRAEQLAERLRAVEQSRESELARLRQELQDHERQAQDDLDRLRQESVAERAQSTQRLDELRVRAVEMDLLRQQRDERQNELVVERGRAEQLAERLRALEQSRETELARLRQELQNQERLTQDEQDRLRQESLAQRAQSAQRLNELKTRAAEMELLRQERDERQNELVVERDRAEQLAERLRAVEQARESELARLRQELQDHERLSQEEQDRLRQELQDHERTAEDEQDRLRQETLAQQAQFAQRLDELRVRAAQMDLLRQEGDRRQNEIITEQVRAEQLAERLRAVEEAPESEPARSRWELPAQPTAQSLETDRVREVSHLARERPPDSPTIAVRPATAQRPAQAGFEPLSEPESTAGAGLLGDELMNRLLDFKAKREDATWRSRLRVAAVVAALLLAVVAGVVMLYTGQSE